MGTPLPAGTVTFLFTDVEGSTKLLHALGADGYADALATHRQLLRDAFERNGGVEVDTQGDAFFVAFPTAPGALAAAREATAALAEGPIRVRIGLHTGTPLLTDEGYVGPDVHKGARIAAAGHGGQVLVSAATAALVGTGGLRDLGLHRLKDLTAAERIYQLGDGEHPPLKTLHQSNLPVPATPFLGRESELAELAALLGRDDLRLVTMTGPGGTGKTRLALQAAADAADDFAGGVWWVPLAPLRDPALVLESAAQALGASGDLAEHIGDTRLLLLLDNFEHLTSAATDLAPLRSRCPNLTMLVTSRERLHLAGEHEYAVDSLQPDEAVELFLARAIAVRHDVIANGEVAVICERLDRLPLAIELAAARVKVLSPQAMLQRLEQRLPLLAGGARDVPERQRTLRATIEWSHELLTPEEQRLFACLAVFRGGCTLDAAEAIADADLDTLTSLVDKSLVRVRPESGRFSMLETIREFALERLTASGEADEVRRRHTDFFLSLAKEAEPHLLRDSGDWLDRLQADEDNLRAAMDRLLAEGDRDDYANLATRLWRFWYNRSRLSEGRRRLDAALSVLSAPNPLRAAALRGASVMAMNLGDPDRGLDLANEALELDRALGHEWGVAYATMIIGHCLTELDEDRRDLSGARERYLEAAELFRRTGDEHFALLAHHNQAWIVGELGNREAEMELHRADLVAAREIGNEQVEGDCLSQLGTYARDQGRFAEALELGRQALRIDVRRGMTLHVADQLSRIASVLVRHRRPNEAASLLGASDALLDQLGTVASWWAVERNAETRAALAEALGGETADRLIDAGRGMSEEDAVELALSTDLDAEHAAAATHEDAGAR